MRFYFDPNMDPELQELIDGYAIKKAREAIAKDEARIKECEERIAEIEYLTSNHPQPTDHILLDWIVDLRRDIDFYRSQVSKLQGHIKVLSLTKLPEPTEC